MAARALVVLQVVADEDEDDDEEEESDHMVRDVISSSYPPSFGGACVSLCVDVRAGLCR